MTRFRTWEEAIRYTRPPSAKPPSAFQRQLKLLARTLSGEALTQAVADLVIARRRRRQQREWQDEAAQEEEHPAPYARTWAEAIRYAAPAPPPGSPGAMPAFPAPGPTLTPPPATPGPAPLPKPKPPVASPMPRQAPPPRVHPWQEPLPEDAHLQGLRAEGFSRDTSHRAYHLLTQGGAYFAKNAGPVEARIEHAVGQIHQLIGMPNVPALRMVKRGRRYHVVSQMVEGVPLSRVVGSLIHRPNPAALAELKRNTSPQEMADMVLGNWIVHADDRHPNNYMVEGGKVIPIDYGNSLYPHWKNQGNWNTHEEALIQSGLVKKSQPLNLAMIKRILDNRSRIAVFAIEAITTASGFSKRRQREMADMLREKFEHLESLLRQRRRPTLADLHDHPSRAKYSPR